MTNKKMGNRFEQELCSILYANGFWVHNFTQNQAGQPADIIAAKNGKVMLIDAKVCSNNRFKLGRIEENQNLSMKLWNDCGNGTGWFALKIDTGIYMIPMSTMSIWSRFGKQLNKRGIETFGKRLEEWIENVSRLDGE